METTTRNRLYGKDAIEWWVIGFWIRLALAGAIAAFGGVAMLADQATLDLSALGLIVVGAAVATGAKRMAQRALDRLDAAPVDLADPAASASQALPQTPPPVRRRRAWAISP